MRKIIDNYGNLACMADASTGRVEHEYKRCRIVTTLPIGGCFTVNRGGRTTVISRTDKGFIAVSRTA